MREIDESLLIHVSGAGGDQADKNQQLLNTLGSSMVWGVGLGAVGGPVGAVAGAITGAAGAALQTVPLNMARLMCQFSLCQWGLPGTAVAVVRRHV